jgi:hypothetical protein
LDGEYDDTDYLDLHNGGKLKPGMLLECAGYVDDQGIRRRIVMSNSGIKVKKDDVVRVTVAKHGWDAVKDKVVHHPTGNSHDIGTIVEEIGEDIGLPSGLQMPIHQRITRAPDESEESLSFLTVTIQ